MIPFTTFDGSTPVRRQSRPWPGAKGSYTSAVDNQISFRWGMYVGSKKGHSIPDDGLLLVTEVSIR